MIISRKKLFIGGAALVSAGLLLLSILMLLKSGQEVHPAKEKLKELTFYTWTGDHYFRHMAALFEEENRISLRIVVNNPDVYIRKAILESDLAVGSMNCILINSSYQRGQLAAADVLPQQGEESGRGGFTALYRTVSGIAYDRNVLSRPPRDSREFRQWIRENPEKFGFTPVNADGGFSFIYSVLSTFNLPNQETPWEWFRSSKESMLYTSSDYDSLRLLSSGKLQLTSVPEHLMLEAVSSGEISPSISMYTPDFGSVSDTYGIAIPRNAADKEDAARFIRFLQRESSQKIMREMLYVRPLNKSSGTEYLTPPHAEQYKQIVDSFKDKVLYH